jgi:hypothetical protein
LYFIAVLLVCARWVLPEAERDAALALERAIYSDLFPVVPNIKNRNNSAALKLSEGIVTAQLVTVNKKGA